MSYENNCAHLKMKGELHSATTQFGSWFLLKKNHKVHVSSPWCMRALKVSRRHTISLWAFNLPLCKLVAFRKYIYLHVNMYLLTEGGRSFKTFLKENYAIALDSCYLLLNMELNTTLIVLMEKSDIPEIYSRFEEYLAI